MTPTCYFKTFLNSAVSSRCCCYDPGPAHHHSVSVTLAASQTDLSSFSLSPAQSIHLHWQTHLSTAPPSLLYKDAPLISSSSHGASAQFPAASMTHPLKATASLSRARPWLQISHTPQPLPQIFTEQILALKAVLSVSILSHFSPLSTSL